MGGQCTCEREIKCIHSLVLYLSIDGRIRVKWIFCGLNLSEAE